MLAPICHSERIEISSPSRAFCEMKPLFAFVLVFPPWSESKS